MKRLMRVFAVISSILLLALFAGSIAHAQQVKTDLPVKSPVVANPKDPAAKDPIKRPGKPGGDQFALTPEREAAAMTFVKQHHSELAELVSVLKESRPKEYHKAIRDLYRASEKLADLQQVDLQRYDLELKAWRNQSRLQLLAARVQMPPGDEKQRDVLQAELKAELARQYDVRVEILQLERARVTERVDRLNAQIEKMKQGRESAIDRQLNELVGKQRPAKPNKPAKKPVAKP